jgi:putative FmdB family regulatory protein
MPLYEYQCFVCESRFERIQKVSDDIIKDCPSCGGRVRRLLGVPALQFKGSGWYVTDYGKGNGRSKSEADQPSGNGNGSAKTESKTTETSSESKSAKTETKSTSAQT